MNFTILTEEEFEKFSKESPYRTFMQTKEIASLRQTNGWKHYYVGLKEEEKVIAATLLVAKKRYFNHYEFYAPRGPLLDFNNKEVVTTFIRELKRFIKLKKGYCLRIDPYLSYQERDGAGEIVPGGKNNQKVVSLIKNLGFRKVPLEKQEQVSFMYVLDLENKTEADILKNMKPNTRNTIRKTMKHGIEIEELTEKELPEFYRIMEETAKRKGFDVRDLAYFETMYRLFKPKEEIKYLVTRLHLPNHIKELEKEKEKLKQDYEKLSEAAYNDGKRKALTSSIKGVEKKIALAENFRKKGKDCITLSGSMFVMTDPEIIYLSSGNYEEYLVYNSQYLIQWTMLQYALSHGYKRYNFYGIPSTFDKNDKDYGIYEFKTGFNGYVEELIGEYVLPLSIIYTLIHLLQKAKHILKRPK